MHWLWPAAYAHMSVPHLEWRGPWLPGLEAGTRQLSWQPTLSLWWCYLLSPRLLLMPNQQGWPMPCRCHTWHCLRRVVKQIVNSPLHPIAAALTTAILPAPAPCRRVGKQIVNVPSFTVRVDSQKHIDFALNSPFGGGRPGRNKRRSMAAKKGGGGGDDAGDDEE